jgi:uncharacterized protein (TIGR02271 family)
MASNKEKPRNPDSNRDPITGEPGAHPVGAGVGAAIGGGAAGAALGAAGSAAAAGAALGAAAGPVGVVVGAVAGGVVGGLVGKQVAERINPTAEDSYWKDKYKSRPYVDPGAPYEEYQPAYRYGWESQGHYQGKHFDQVEADLKSGWDKAQDKSKLGWDKAKHAVRDAWDRVSGGHEQTSATTPHTTAAAATSGTCEGASGEQPLPERGTMQLREEELQAHKQPVEKGDVRVRKEVVTEQKTLDVPVQREEVVVERRPVTGRPAAGTDIRSGEEIRIPVKEEEIHVEKRPVVREEVSVGKRQVQDTHKVGGTVRKEQVRIDKEGDVTVRDDSPQNKK